MSKLAQVSFRNLACKIGAIFLNLELQNYTSQSALYFNKGMEAVPRFHHSLLMEGAY